MCACVPAWCWLAQATQLRRSRVPIRPPLHESSAARLNRQAERIARKQAMQAHSGKLVSQPRGMTASGHLIDSVPCTVTTKWTSTDNSPNFDHAEYGIIPLGAHLTNTLCGRGTVDAHRSPGLTTFNISKVTACCYSAFQPSQNVYTGYI